MAITTHFAKQAIRRRITADELAACLAAPKENANGGRVKQRAGTVELITSTAGVLITIYRLRRRPKNRRRFNMNTSRERARAVRAARYSEEE